MSDEIISQLRQQVEDLQAQLSERDDDVSRYKQELISANNQLESLIMNLNHDIKVMHQIQKLLIPTEFPSISGFEFSTKFIAGGQSGGDYLDIFSHMDKLRFGVLVSSSSGYGASTLLLSILLKLTGTMEARTGAEPEKVVEMIRSEAVQSLKPEEFSDVFYARVDRRSFEMDYCLLGDISVLVQEYSSGELKLLPATQGPISAQLKQVKASQKLSLNPRDRIIIVSKGVLQAENIEGEAYGLKRLMGSIAKAPSKGVHELRNQLLFDVQNFASGKNQKADRTVVVAEVKDRVIKLAKKN